MAAVAISAMQSPGPSTPPPSLPDESPMALALAASTPLPVPNKHLPTPIYTITSSKSQTPVTPPASPPPQRTPSHSFNTSVLYPPTGFDRIVKDPPVYGIDASEAASAIKQAASRPLPEAEKVFPWLHGLHQDNQVQLSFFNARKRTAQRTPSQFREVTIVKVGKSLETSKLKGAILPGEILLGSCHTSGFLDLDPPEGFGVRNFHIQTAKIATVSDIIVYGDGSMSKETVKNFAKRISAAQIKTRKLQSDDSGEKFPEYNTFLVQSTFSVFEALYPEVVAFDSKGYNLSNVPDLPQLERVEMCLMSRASEISHNIWLGSTLDRGDFEVGAEPPYHLLIEACDQATFPTTSMMRIVGRRLKDARTCQELEFPASGGFVDFSRRKCEAGALVAFCRWLYGVANGFTKHEHAKNPDKKGRGHKVLLHCMDGYTETSLLALAYLVYSEGIKVHNAWLRLHCEKNRNFFAYQSDLQFLLLVEHDLLADSLEANPKKDMERVKAPRWISRMDGSLPSRILPYMYLGNICHANNPEMLKQLGIRRILSIGETTNWTREDRSAWGEENILSIINIQDNGVDPVIQRLEECLNFIEKGKAKQEATLVHCRVGVSRSATICIAEVVRELKLSVPRAYCFVRARRLNVIIQPHLRFMYELLKWEEEERTESGLGVKRDLEWASIAREISLMNRPYSSR